MAEIKQVPEEETTLIFIVGDALRFSMRILDPSEADPTVKVPRNLTGYLAKAQIRKSFKVSDPILAEFEFNDLDETGEINAYLSGSESAKLEGLSAGRWDLQLIDPSGDPLTYLRGPARPAGQVTR